MCQYRTIETYCPGCKNHTKETRTISTWCPQRHIHNGCLVWYIPVQESVECTSCKNKREVTDEIDRRRRWEISHPGAAQLLASRGRRNMKDTSQQTETPLSKVNNKEHPFNSGPSRQGGWTES
ncbi:hypothetical protein ACHAP8_010697, partial [Fusarium lateritium]